MDFINKLGSARWAFLLCTCFVASQLYAQQTLTKRWDRRFGGEDFDRLSQIIATNDKGYLLVGSSISVQGGDVSQPNRGTGSDYWIVKVDTDGNKLWDRRYGGTSYDNLSQAIPTRDGGFLLGGLSYSGMGGDKTEPSRGGTDYWVVRIDSNGNKLWDKRYGGSKDDDLLCMAPTSDGGYILGGVSSSNAGGDKTEDDWDPSGRFTDYWIVKIDSAGNKQWDRRFGGESQEDLHSVIQVEHGSYLLVGESESGQGGDRTVPNNTQGGYDSWIIKIDSAGNKLWDKQFGYFPYDIEIYSVSLAPDSSYRLMGEGGDSINTNGGTWISKMDTAGNLEWTKVIAAYPYILYFGSNNYTILPDGSYLIAMATRSPPDSIKTEPNLGDQQSWVLKLDTACRRVWDKTIFTTGFDQDAYVAQGTDGCYLVGNSNGDSVGGYMTEPQGNTRGVDDYWVVKMCDTIVSGITNVVGSQANVSVYPNPFVSDIAITIQLQNAHQTRVAIYNTLGQLFYDRTEYGIADTYTKMLSLGSLPNGLYFIEVTVDGQTVVKKVVKGF